MKKILIVDDEIFVRVGFRSILDWESCGFTVVGDAANGLEAMEKIRTMSPDLVFTDLMMDTMDGFQLMKKCANEFPRVKFIVLSSYNDFENVREAMRCGALDYVFKLDVKPEQLRKLLGEIQWDSAVPMAMNQEDERTIRIRVISHSITGDVDEDHLRGRIEVLFPRFRLEEPFSLVTVAIDDYDLRRSMPQERMSFSDIREVENIMEEVMAQQVILCPFQPDRTLLIWQEQNAQAIQKLQAGYAKAEEYVRRYLNQSVTAVMSEEQRGLEGLRRAHAQNEETLSYRYLLDPGRIHGYHPEIHEPDPSPYLDIGELETALRRHDGEMVREICARIFQCLRRKRGYPLPKLRVFLLDILFAVRREYPSISEWQSQDGYSLERLIQRSDRLSFVRSAMEQALQACLEPKGQFSRRAEINQIIAYVRSHLAEEMNITMAAQMTHLSESYFAHIFKREVKSSFIDWLNRERILRAQELLCQTSMRVHEIAAAVGIDNANYFSNLFKKITGKTPMELRDKHKKQNCDNKAELE